MGETRGLATRLSSMARATAAASAFVLCLAGASWADTAATSAPGTEAGSTGNAPIGTETESNLPAAALAAGGPGFNEHYFNTAVAIDLSENYTTNAAGIAGSNAWDFYSALGANFSINTERRRFALHAGYSLTTNLYARHSRLDQLTNNLNAAGDIEIIPNHLRVDAQAYAAPQTLSPLGVLTSNGRSVPNGTVDTYGYSVQPDFRFRIGDALTSDLVVTHGGAFFVRPHSASPVPVIPGFVNPTDTLSTSVTERLSSGPFFGRFRWELAGSDAEIRGIGSHTVKDDLSERTGLATLSYAVTHGFSLLVTGGYEWIHTSVKLAKKLSGPVVLAGFQVNLGPAVQAQFQAGRQFNSASYTGSLHWELTPTLSVAGLLTDSVTTPAAQLISSLTNLASTPTGQFVNGNDLYASGAAPALANFNPGLFNPLSFQQSISRVRAGQLAVFEDLHRNHFSLGVHFASNDYLSPLPHGATRYSQALYGTFSAARDIRRNFRGFVSVSYGTDQEFGGRGNILNTMGGLDYQLSERMTVYLHSSYVNRQSSLSLRKLSPFTGKLNEAVVSLGLRRTF